MPTLHSFVHPHLYPVEYISLLHRASPPPSRDCVGMGGNAMLVILNEVKNFIESIGWKTKILRLMPQNDITTQSPRGRG